MSRVRDDGNWTSFSTARADGGTPNNNSLDNCGELQLEGQEVIDPPTTNINMALLLSLGSMGNLQRGTQQHFNLPVEESYTRNIGSNDILNNYSTNLVQQYLNHQQQQQRQQQQHLLEQNLLAQRLQHIQRLRSTLSHDSLGLYGPLGITNELGLSPISTSALQANDFTQNAQSFQLHNLNHQDVLIEALLATSNNSNLSLQQSYGDAPSQLTLLNALDESSSILRDQSLRHTNQLFLSSALETNVSSFAGRIPYATIAPSANEHPNDEKASVAIEKANQKQAPIRALSAYNFFFKYERERILNSKENEHDIDFDVSQKNQDALLKVHWNRDRSVKRRHRKSHGKISFADLSKKISQRWKELPEDQRNFFNQVAAKDWERYHREMEQQQGCGKALSTGVKNG